MIATLVALAVIAAGLTLYFAWKSRDFRKFLSPAAQFTSPSTACVHAAATDCPRS
jgi:hypothetical protein